MSENISLSLSLAVSVVFVVVVFVMKAVLLPRWCVFQRFSQTGTERSCSLSRSLSRSGNTLHQVVLS